MSRFTRIQAALKPIAAEKPNDDEELPESPEGKPPCKSKKKDKSMPETEEGSANADALASAREEGVKAANDRMNAVFASEHYPGREAHAAKLLGKKNLSAEDIIDVLADYPKVETQAADPEAVKAAAEKAARDQMAEAIAETGNSNVDAGATAKPADKRAEADSVWAKARPLAEEKGVK